MGISESVALVNGFFISANVYCSFDGMASMNGEMSELQWLPHIFLGSKCLRKTGQVQHLKIHE